MTKGKAPAPRDTTIRKVGKSASIMDGVLAVVFLSLALHSGWWFWWASSAFCALTAIFSPLEHFGNFMSRRMLTVKSAK